MIQTTAAGTGVVHYKGRPCKIRSFYVSTYTENPLDVTCGTCNKIIKKNSRTAEIIKDEQKRRMAVIKHKEKQRMEEERKLNQRMFLHPFDPNTQFI